MDEYDELEMDGMDERGEWDEEAGGPGADAGSDPDSDAREDGEEAGEAEKAPAEEEGGAWAENPDAALQAARAQAAQAAEARVRTRYDREMAASGAVNPYTGEPFQTFREFQSYAEQYRREQLREQAEEEGRPVEELQEEAENRAYLTRKRQEEQAQSAAASQLEQERARLLADALQFQKAFPGVDVGKLEQDRKFQKFCGGRLYREPLTALYQDYLDLMGDAQQAGAARAAGKHSRGTGGGGGAPGIQLTPAQQRELDAWNREFPQMKMTAKEFMAR